MRLNQSANVSTVSLLVINGQPFNIVDYLKYLGSYVSFTEYDVQVWIGLAWSAFSKHKSMLRSSKTMLNFKIGLFKAAFISILPYGHWTYMPTDEPINHFVIYKSKARSSLRPEARARTRRQQISSHLLPVQKALISNI